MAATDVVFSGFYYAVDYTLSVSVAGLDCGDYVVSALGTVTVPLNSDKDQHFNAAYLQQFDVGPYDRQSYGNATMAITMGDGVGGIVTYYLPVVIGFVYPSAGFRLRPVDEGVTKSPQGGSMGKFQRTHHISLLLLNTQGIQLGSLATAVYDQQPLADAGGNVLDMNQLYSGVWTVPIDDNPGFDGMIGWRTLRPFPCTVVALTGFTETNER